ncbi:MAG: YggS family pyridoxal phosphate-dependent enzyme [Thermomicrobiales bacterium]|nr:MAG: YggS family pyridoxal phosphate-dependent enzyme [Thermomicrobiales bacterium]
MSGPSVDSELARRLSTVQQRVALAAEAAGREPSDVTVIGVTKTVGREAVDEAYQLGMRCCGENRVQDAKAKFAVPLPDDAELHMIGSLQSNKAKSAAELFDVIQSVDRASLVDTLARQAASSGDPIAILLEINVAGETQKAGCPLGDAPKLLDMVLAHAGLHPLGLMTMAPLTDDQNAVRPVFRGLRNLAVALQERSGVALPILSMGMSNDFEAAIAEGATHVRVGRAIFGG